MNNNNNKDQYKTPETSPRDPFGVDSPLTPENYSTHTPTIVAPPPPSLPPPLVTRPSTNPIVTNYINIIRDFYTKNRNPVASIASFTNVFIDNLPLLDTTNPQQAIDLYNAIINQSSPFFRLNQQQNTNINLIIESAYINIQLHYSNINIRGGRKSKKNRKTKKSKITAGMFRFIFGDQNEEERHQRETMGPQYDPEDPYAHSTWPMVRPLPYEQRHRPDTNLYPVTIPSATNAQIVPPNDNEPQTKKTKKKQTIQEPIISNLKRIDLPGTVLTRRLITDRIATSANESIQGPDAANAAAFESSNYNRLRRKEIEIPLEIRKLIRRINYYEEELDKTDDVLLKDRHALAEQSYNPNEGIRFTAAPNAPYETKRLVEDRSHLIGEQNNRKIRLEFLQNKLRHIKNKIKEHEDKALTTIPDEDVRWMPGGKRKTRKNIGKEDFGTWKDGSSVFKDKKGFFVIQWNPKKNMEYKKYLNNWKPKPQKNRLVLVKNKWYIKKSNKRKTRNKKKGGGNSISLFEEFKSLDELKSHLVNNIKVPTGSRSDPGKLNIDAVTRANNKTRNKKEKSVYRKSLKKKLKNRKH